MSAAQVLAGKRLIVVEDSAIIRMSVEESLRDAGAFIVRSFRDRADGAVLDIKLEGGATAISIAMTLRSRKVPFLFYTGLQEAMLWPIRARWPGCKILAKPASAQEIVAAVADMLDEPAQRRKGASPSHHPQAGNRTSSKAAAQPTTKYRLYFLNSDGRFEAREDFG